MLEEHATADDGSAPAPGGADGISVPWVLSAKTEPALRAMAAELGDFLTAQPTPTAEVGISLARTRAGFKRRAVSVGPQPASTSPRSRLWPEARTHPAWSPGRPPPRKRPWCSPAASRDPVTRPGGWRNASPPRRDHHALRERGRAGEHRSAAGGEA
ncbi:hypothetical protein OH735_31165 [Streptomyces sp. NBC_01618]|nr:hypothetical protein OH735_31165 [Streptomyces sp. NBC_01618]